jgi:DNA-binding MarR family transcriptional regulator
VSTIPERQDAVNDRRRSAAGDAFSAFALLVLRLSNRLGAAGDALARPVHQSSARWQVLAGAEDGRMTVADIARTLGLARQSVQRVADVLETDGLVAYVDNPRHRRARHIALTPRGRETLSVIQAAQARWADELGRRMGERDLERANKVLERALGLLAHDPDGGA